MRANTQFSGHQGMSVKPNQSAGFQYAQQPQGQQFLPQKQGLVPAQNGYPQMQSNQIPYQQQYNQQPYAPQNFQPQAFQSPKRPMGNNEMNGQMNQKSQFASPQQQMMSPQPRLDQMINKQMLSQQPRYPPQSNPPQMMQSAQIPRRTDLIPSSQQFGQPQQFSASTYQIPTLQNQQIEFQQPQQPTQFVTKSPLEIKEPKTEENGMLVALIKENQELKSQLKAKEQEMGQLKQKVENLDQLFQQQRKQLDIDDNYQVEHDNGYVDENY